MNDINNPPERLYFSEYIDSDGGYHVISSGYSGGHKVEYIRSDIVGRQISMLEQTIKKLHDEAIREIHARYK